MTLYVSLKKRYVFHVCSFLLYAILSFLPYICFNVVSCFRPSFCHINMLLPFKWDSTSELETISIYRDKHSYMCYGNSFSWVYLNIFSIVFLSKNSILRDFWFYSKLLHTFSSPYCLEGTLSWDVVTYIEEGLVISHCCYKFVLLNSIF